MNFPYPAPAQGLAPAGAVGSNIMTGFADHGPHGAGALCMRIPRGLPLLNSKSQRLSNGFHRADSSPISPSQSSATASSSLLLHSDPPAKYRMFCSDSRFSRGITA